MKKFEYDEFLKKHTLSSMTGIEIWDVLWPFAKTTDPFCKPKSELPLLSLHVTLTVPRLPPILTMESMAFEDSDAVVFNDAFAKLNTPYALSLGRIEMLRYDAAPRIAKNIKYRLKNWQGEKSKLKQQASKEATNW